MKHFLIYVFSFAYISCSAMEIAPEYRCEFNNEWPSGQLIFAKMVSLYDRQIMYLTFSCDSWIPRMISSGCECDHQAWRRNDPHHHEIAKIFLGNFKKTLTDLGYSSAVAPGVVPLCIFRECKKIAIGAPLIIS